MAAPLDNIYSLIPRVMNDIGAIAKTRKNTQQGYAFRGIEDFYQAAHPALITHGVFCAPEVVERTEYRFEKTNDAGRVTTWLHVTLKVRHRFYAPDASYVDVTTYGEGLDNSDKASNKAMSGAMKYALIELFSVPTQDVEDADRETPETGTRRKPVARTTEYIPLEPDVVPVPDEFIDEAQQKRLHNRFKETLAENLRDNADGFLHDFLARKMLIDAFGNPSSKGIRRDQYVKIGTEAVAFAKTINETGDILA